MTYRSLYRAWRPQAFREVLGQEHVTRTLTNAISSGRLGHAYLFCGPRGTGKTSTAKILAKALNCQHGPTPEPCDECPLCKRIREGYCLDVLEMDAASNRGIDEIRSLRDQVNLSPTEARYKVYIIDEVHMLTAEAFNAFLKTLEEPPERVVFVLATTEPERIPATILSRCQRFDFHRLTPEIIKKRLLEVAQVEGVELEERTAHLVARSAEGSMRDALGLLEQCISYSGQRVEHGEVLELLGATDSETLTEILAAVGGRDVARVLARIDQLRSQGKDPRLFFKDLVLWLRNLMLVCVFRNPEPLLSISTDEVRELKQAGANWSTGRLTKALKELTAHEGMLRWAAQPWIVLETALAELCLGESETTARAPVSQVQAATALAPRPRAAQKKEPLQIDEVADTSAPLSPVPQSRTELSLVKETWPRILEEVKARGPAVEAVWRYGQPESVEDATLNVGFSSEGIKKVAAQPDKLQTLEEAIEAVLKIRLTVYPRLAQQATPSVQPAGKSEPPGIEEARRLFGADKVVVKDRQ
jgi:DNA polymerase-3 subunit gamma/tau